MDILVDHEEFERLNTLYSQAREAGNDFVGLLDLCFDGGDSVDEAEYHLRTSLHDTKVAATEVGINTYFGDQ